MKSREYVNSIAAVFSEHFAFKESSDEGARLVFSCRKITQNYLSQSKVDLEGTVRDIRHYMPSGNDLSNYIDLVEAQGIEYDDQTDPMEALKQIKDLDTHIATIKFYSEVGLKLEALAEEEGKSSEADAIWTLMGSGFICNPRWIVETLNGLVDYSGVGDKYKLKTPDQSVIGYVNGKKETLFPKPSLIGAR